MRFGANATLYFIILGLIVGAKTTTLPAPLVIPSSQDWDGNDGPWSSFALQVGTPPQNVKVLIGTSATQTWVIVPDGCTSSDPSNCGTLRGGEFIFNQSTTWTKNTANISNNLYELNLESSLGYAGNGQYGFDTISLGWQGSGSPTLKNQTLAGIATKDFYMGLFGLTPRPSNFSTFNEPVPSYIENLRSQSLIPSTSWAYTAGNRYRLEEVLGSLILGGYDASRFIPNNASWLFNQRDIRDLTVPISSITMTNSNSTISLLQSTVAAFIDSSVPHLWLPLEVCKQFERAFNLTWNNETQLYLLDEYQQAKLLAMNASITFTLQSQAGNVNITLPFAAFDLIVNYPIIANATYYFPLKRATNIDQYTLGRAFLQEAYIIVDYDRRNFSVSQCNWEVNNQQKIVAIYPPIKATSHRFPLVPIICSIVGGISSILLAALAYYLIIIKPQGREPKVEKQSSTEQKPGPEPSPYMKPELDVGPTRAELDYNPGGIEVDGDEIHEMAEKVVVVEVEGKNIEIHEMDAEGQQLAVELSYNPRVFEL